MDPLHATLEEFAADGYTHVEANCPRCRVIRLRPIDQLSKISMGLTLDGLARRLRCAKCGCLAYVCGLLYRWQTLAGSLIALLAGAAAVAAVIYQTNATAREARDRGLRLARSFRAIMPEDLANVGVYARECAQTLLLILKFISDKKRSEKPSLPIPQLGERILDNFRQLIENLDDADSEKVADLVAAYQIQHSRFLSVIRDFQKPNRHGVEQIISENYVVDVGMISVRGISDSALPFALPSHSR